MFESQGLKLHRKRRSGKWDLDDSAEHEPGDLRPGPLRIGVLLTPFAVIKKSVVHDLNRGRTSKDYVQKLIFYSAVVTMP